METQGNEDTALGCCCGPQDMEMKNAVAIQRNAAAIAVVIKSLQAIQSEVDDTIALRLTNIESTLSELQNLISGEGGIVERVNELEEATSGLNRDVNAVMKTVYHGPRCEITTDVRTFSVPIAQDAPEYDDDSDSLP